MRRYAATIFLSAFLLFEVQLLLAKHILPWFGGSASVWTTSMLFFQMLLLAGYGYAHGVAARLGPLAQRRLHLALVGLSLLSLALLWVLWGNPLLADAGWKPADSQSPVTHILLLLTISVGLPFLVLSATNPLVQSWFSRAHPGVSPYRLYALSNAGSLAGLLAYPFVIEPLVALKLQAVLWAIGFVLFALGLVLCAREIRHAPASRTRRPSRERVAPPPAPGRRLLWLLLAACASVLLLAATNQMTQEIAVVPMLWVLPLTLYLLSFILCFESERWYARGPYGLALVVMLPVSGMVLELGIHAPLLLQIGAYSLTLFVCCMICHGELARLKPPAQFLTQYYFVITVGGAAGGLFVALAAPALFRGYWEFQLGLLACALLIAFLWWRGPASLLNRARPWPAWAALAGAASLAVAVTYDHWDLGVLALPAMEISPVLLSLATVGSLPLLAPAPWRERAVSALRRQAVRRCGAGPSRRRGAREGRGTRWHSLGVVALAIAVLAVGLGATAVDKSGNEVRSTRNFYGVLHIVEEPADDHGQSRVLLRHGRITHGYQYQQGPLRRQLVAYYSPDSGIGLALRYHPRRIVHQPLRVGVIGLGSGTLAAGGRPGDVFRFYEINPAVIALSQGPAPTFSYLHDSRARIEMALGDARLVMERELAAGRPQRFDVLAVDAFSSDAIPAHLLTAEAFALYLAHLRDRDGILAVHISNRFLDLRPVVLALARHHGLAVAVVDVGSHAHTYESTWVLLSRDPKVLATPAIADAAEDVSGTRPTGLWRDDYSSLLTAIKW
jgi:spermidine synthase